MPASSAAQNGCRRGLVLYLANVRRRTAPAAALATMSKTAAICWTPKITDSDAAPAAAATVNSQVGAGGDCEIVSIVFTATDGARRPATTSSIARIAEATRYMSTPVGSVAPTATGIVPESPNSSSNSPQRGMTLALRPSLLPSRSVAAMVSSVDSPLTCNTRAKLRMRSARSGEFIITHSKTCSQSGDPRTTVKYGGGPKPAPYIANGLEIIRVHLHMR